MKEVKRLSSIVLVLTLLSCATKVPYSNRIQKQHEIEGSDVKMQQFYLLGSVELERKRGDGRSISRVVIPSGTYGRVERVEKNTIHISFERDKSLKFTISEIDGKYRLCPIPGKTELKGRKIVNYGGEEFYVSTGSLEAVLMIHL